MSVNMFTLPQSLRGLATIIDQQGWNDASVAHIALAYIATGGHSSDFLVHAATVAEMESPEGEGEEGTADSEPDSPAWAGALAGVARAEPPAASLLAAAPEILRELVEQLDGLGIPEWAGAEGLSLEAARSFLAGDAGQPATEANEYQQALAAVSWDESDFPYADWQHDVACGDTRRSYADWVLANREQVVDEQPEGAAQ